MSQKVYLLVVSMLTCFIEEDTSAEAIRRREALIASAYRHLLVNLNMREFFFSGNIGLLVEHKEIKSKLRLSRDSDFSDALRVVYMEQGGQIARGMKRVLTDLHLLPKVVAIALYFVLGLLRDPLLHFSLVGLTAAVDFWFVKNVTGRRLMGFLWWVDLDKDENEFWVFESAERENT